MGVSLMRDLDHRELHECAYLIERETRPLAVVCSVPADSARGVFGELQTGAAYSPGAVPFVVERGDGMADCGYATAQWAVDLYRWVLSDDVPECHRDRVCGLLFGYSPAAIERFEVRKALNLRVVGRPMAARTWRELISHRFHVNRPVATVR